ncbi:hypothetical protein [Azospirillum largimobile]
MRHGSVLSWSIWASWRKEWNETGGHLSNLLSPAPEARSCRGRQRRDGGVALPCTP